MAISPSRKEEEAPKNQLGHFRQFVSVILHEFSAKIHDSYAISSGFDRTQYGHDVIFYLNHHYPNTTGVETNFRVRNHPKSAYDPASPTFPRQVNIPYYHDLGLVYGSRSVARPV
jgi:hypothetical protein